MAKDAATRILERSIARLGLEAQLIRLADTADAQAAGGRGIKAQPGDQIFLWLGYGGVVEVKQSHDEIGFPLKNVRDSQWRACTRAKRGKQNYAFFIYNVDKFCYLVPGNWLLNFKEQKVRSNVPWGLLQPFKLWWVESLEVVSLAPLLRLWKEDRRGMG